MTPHHSFLILLLLLPVFPTTGALYGHAVVRCVFTSREGFDAVYLEQYYFNKMLMGRYNSTVGKMIPCRESVKRFADAINSNQDMINLLKWKTDRCKNQVPSVFEGLMNPVEPYVRLRSIREASSEHPGLLLCSVYDFYPKQIKVTWLRNGDEIKSQFEFDAEELLYVDLSKKEVVYTVPSFLDPDPSKILKGLSILQDALDNKNYCLFLTKAAEVEKISENRDPPESFLYPSEEVELGVENLLICFVNHFYPPSISVSWTRNGHPVSEGVSLSRYYPNNDQTFHQFSTLTFTPTEGDIYSCTVEHEALETPTTRFWEPDEAEPNFGPDIFCGVGLGLAFLGVATGVFFIVKAQTGQ